MDVFFVISGYLIALHMITDCQRNRFNIMTFYERRARRIFPSLFLVTFVCIPFAWLWMLPDALENFGESAVATVFGANNILLYRTSGYWSLTSAFKPLLHTWALGVELQFYLLAPLVGLLFWRILKKRVWMPLTALGLGSYIGCELLLRANPQANYYLLPTRLWELLAGVGAAYVTHKVSVRQNSLGASLGLGMVISAVFLYEPTTPFPGAYTLLPVGGAVLIALCAGPRTAVGRLLSRRPLVTVGLFSYGLYLWHQPLFALARVYAKSEPEWVWYALLIGASAGLAYLSWRFIELPFRDRRLVQPRVFLGVVVMVGLLLVGFGYAAYSNHGFVGRVFASDVASASEMYISYNERNMEFKTDGFPVNGRVNALVIGDSFGRDVVNIIRETYDMTKLNLVYRDDYFDASLSGEVAERLFDDAGVVFVAVASWPQGTASINELIGEASRFGTRIFFVGPKQFGYNMNWMARIRAEDRGLLRNKILPGVIAEENEWRRLIPADDYISIMEGLSNGDGILITDEMGRLLSPDGKHLTRYGAIYIGREVFLRSSATKYLLRGAGQIGIDERLRAL